MKKTILILFTLVLFGCESEQPTKVVPTPIVSNPPITHPDPPDFDAHSFYAEGGERDQQNAKFEAEQRALAEEQIRLQAELIRLKEEREELRNFRLDTRLPWEQ